MNIRTALQFWVQTFAFCSLSFAGWTANAAWVIQPSAEIRTGYEDNIRLDENDQSGFRNLVSAQARISSITETTSISLIGNLSYLMYADVEDIPGVDDLNNEDQQAVNLAAQTQAERFVMGVRGVYRRDILLRRTEFIPDGFDGATDPANMISLDDPLSASQIDTPDINTNTSTEQVRRTLMSADPYLRYELTENMQTEIGYQFYGLRYGSGADQARLQDSDTNAIYGGLRFRASQIDAFAFRVRASKFEPDEGLNTDNYETTISWNRQVSERFNFGLRVGGSRVESDQENNNGWLFNANAAYRTEVSRISGYIGRQILPGGYGDIVEADTARLNFSRDLGARWSFDIDANGYRTTNTTNGQNGLERKFASVTPSINWELTEEITLGLGYTYDWVDRNDEPDSYSGNSVAMTLRYSPPSQL